MQQPDWLDTETRSILSKMPPVKQTAIGLESYSLLLLKVGDDCHRIQQVVSDICPTHAEGVKDFVGVPIVIARKMSLDDVMAGQFALACCDCVSAFVVDEVVDDGNAEYLLQLSEAVKNSDEFEVVAIKLILIPTTEAGRHFSWQFLGMAVGFRIPCQVLVHRKKARLMWHWAAKCGVQLEDGVER